MKKLFLFIAIALCVASYSSPLSAKEDKNTEVTLIAGGDTINCSQAILDKYGPEKVAKAYQKGKLICDSIVVTKGYIIQRRTVFYLSLVKEGNKIVESISSPTTTSKFDWSFVYFFGFIIIGILFFYFLWLRLPSKG